MPGETPREYIRRIYADTSNCGTTLNNALYTTWETAFNTVRRIKSARQCAWRHVIAKAHYHVKYEDI